MTNDRRPWIKSACRSLCILAVGLQIIVQSAWPMQQDELAPILAGLNQASAQFRTVMADLEYSKVTVIVNDTSTEKGKIYFERYKGKFRVMLAFTTPAEKYVLFAGNKVSIYRPKIAEVDEFSLGKNQGLVEEFLLLGFGTSGTDLQKSYQVALKGKQMLEGEPVVHLELTPKSAAVSARLRRIELWISTKTWQPLQQKFTEPSNDYLIARYLNSKQNQKLPADAFNLPLRGKVRTTKH